MRGQRGFSILEAMVALLIIGIALVGSVVVTINAAGYVKATTHRIIAQGIAQGEIGKLRVLGFQSVNLLGPQSETSILLDEGSPENPNDAVFATMTRTVLPLDLDGDGTTDLLKLKIAVVWEEFGRPHEQESTSLLTKRSF